VELPPLNLLSRPLLLGLIYRALAGGQDGTQAALTLRRLEHLQLEQTELTTQRSMLSTDVELTQQKAAEAKRAAQQAQLDLQLFSEQHPPPPRRRTTLGAGRAQLEQEHKLERERTLLESTAQDAGTSAKEFSAHLEHLRERREQAEQAQAALSKQREQWEHQLAEQLAAQVLALIAEENYEEAESVLAEARKQVRGNLMVATLLVLCALYRSGAATARSMLNELRSIFDQHPDPLRRVLQGVIALTQNEPETSPILLDAAQFTHRAHYRLHLVVQVLRGRLLDEDALRGDPLHPTLWVLHEYARLKQPVASHTPSPATTLAEWAAKADLIERALAAAVLAARDEPALIPAAAGIAFDALKPPRRKNESWPELMALLSVIPQPAWPAALTPEWRTALACLLLLAAREYAPAPLYEQWLAESYNWPKTDLYWWTLARLKDDPALAGNIHSDSEQLFSVAQL